MKYTHTLGSYIVEHYNIPDRGGDDAYQSWEVDSQCISSAIRNQEFMLFVSVEGNCDTSVPKMTMLFDALGIPRDTGNEIWYVNNKKGILHASGEGEYEKDFRLDYHDVYITRMLDEDTGEYVNSVMIDNLVYGKVEDGINITVYNPVTQSVVESFGVDRDGEVVR